MRSPPRALLLGALALTLGGCAVARIDVDVYKGPLANHQDVQTEQMAVMAIGAKPLLIQLRDTLLGLEKIQTLRDSGAYKEDGRIRCSAENPFCLEKCAGADLTLKACAAELPRYRNAKQVNGILTLYRDRVSDPNVSRLAQLTRQAKAAQHGWKKASSRFLTGVGPRPDVYWAKLRSRMYPALRDDKLKALGTQHPLVLEKPRARDVFHLDAVRKLRDAYKTYLGKGPWRNPRKIWAAHQGLQELVRNDPAIAKQTDLLKPIGPYHGSNAAFELLSQGAVVGAHAKLLFPSNIDAAPDFVDQVTSIAKAFLDTRENLHNLLRANLGRLQILGAIPRLDESQRTAKQNTIDIVTTLIGRRNLSAFLQGYRQAPSQPGSTLNLFMAIVANKTGLFSETDDKVKVFVDFLHGQLDRNTVVAAGALSEADRQFTRSDFPVTKLEEPEDRFKPVERRRYGLSRALFPAPNSQGSGVKIVAADKELVATAPTTDIGKIPGAAGLDRGRLDDGLEKLIEDYLTAANAATPAADEVSASRRRLSKALVRFAEKVLFVADNAGLLKTRIELKDTIDKYVLVLQAVGNSILIQADELAHRATHKTKLRDQAPAEQFALQRSLSPGVNKVMDDLIAHFRGIQQDAAQSVAAKTKASEEVKKKLAAAQAALKKLLGLGEADKIPADLSKCTTPVCTGAAKALTKAKDDLTKKEKLHEDLVAAYRTVVGAAASDQSDAGKASRRDAGDIARRIAGIDPAGAPFDGGKIAEEISAWIAPHIAAPPVPDTIRINRLKSAKTYLAAHKGDYATITSRDDPTKALKGIEQVINGHYDDAQNALERLRKAVKEKQIASDDARQEFKQSVSAHTKAGKAVETANQALETATQHQTRAKEIADEIAAQRARVITRASATGTTSVPAVVHALLLSFLDDELTAAKAKNDNASKKNTAVLQQARDDLAAQNPALGTGDVNTAFKPGTGDARDALDRLIAALRHEHILAVRREGANGPQARKIAEAIKAAYDQRSGMAYIRPSGAYLRSSYAATSLQDAAAQQTWKNRLAGHSLRSLPLVGEWFANDAARKLAITTEIDKQFWQNINSVRVAGAGNTNYVIAKDDIGNWYVKTYSADPGPIIKSAKALAMFNLGNQLGTNLLGRSSTDQSQVPGEQGETGSTPLGRVFDRYRTAYDKHTGKDHAALASILKNGDVVKDVRARWSRNTDTSAEKTKLESVLANPENELTAAGRALEKVELAADRGGAIIDALSALRRFHRAVSDGVDATDLPRDDPAVKAAKAELTRAVQPALERFLGSRDQALNDYEGAVLILRDVGTTK